ncbi:ZIP family metal transporter [bacterium]|nr:ZIP family metal transporter [bacterium]
MSILLWIILATVAMSAVSLVGALALVLKENILKSIIKPLVAFSAGSLLGGAFFHLLPETLEGTGEINKIFVILLIGFAVFFLLEQFIHWHHCHLAPNDHKHPVTYLILISDGVHNFLDGLAIGAAFVIDIRLGLATTIAIAMHEIPQELGDFGILIHGGWKKAKALLFNFFSGLTAVAGGIIAWLLAGNIEIVYLLPFAAGNFIYIAASDLIPEIKKNDRASRNIIHFLAFVSGIGFMYALTINH